MKTAIEPISSALPSMPGAQFTDTGLIFARKPSPDAVDKAHKRVLRVMRALPWLHGDTLVQIVEEARKRDAKAMGPDFMLLPDEVISYQQSALHEYATVHGMTPETCRRHYWVAKMFPHSKREGALSFYHHLVCMECKLSLPASAKWLKRAKDGDWTAAQMREEINSSRAPTKAAGRPPEPDIPGGGLDFFSHEVCTSPKNFRTRF